MSDLKERIQRATHTAMKARDKARLAALRLINADLKQVEVDERKVLTDVDVTAVLSRMLKQRKESLAQFRAADRDDLAAQEAFEIEVIRSFLPAPLSEAEVNALVAAAISATGAAGMKDMGKVMGWLKVKAAGRADMAAVSLKVKAKLAAA